MTAVVWTLSPWPGSARVMRGKQRLMWGAEGPNDYHGELTVSPDGDHARVDLWIHTENTYPGIDGSIRQTLGRINTLLGSGVVELGPINSARHVARPFTPNRRAGAEAHGVWSARLVGLDEEELVAVRVLEPGSPGYPTAWALDRLRELDPGRAQPGVVGVGCRPS